MSNWGDYGLDFPQCRAHSHHDRARAALQAALLTLVAFMAPEILIMDDKARFRPRERHVGGLFVVVHQLIEVLVLRAHPGSPNGRH